MLLVHISLFFFFGWLFYVLVRYGIQESISDSWYRLTMENKALFTIATWGYVVPLVLAGVSGNTYQDLILFAAGILLGLVGVFPDFKLPGQRRFHVVGAEGGITVGFIWMLVTGFWYLSILGVIPIYFLFKKKPKNHTWWIECIAYCTILIAVLIKVLNG